MPTPAAAIVVLLPFYIDRVGVADMQSSRGLLTLALVYTLAIALMMVSAVPTYSGKLLGERIKREWVLPLFILVIGFVALLVTYPYGTLAGASLAYLVMIPVSYRRYYAKLAESEATAMGAAASTPPVPQPQIAKPVSSSQMPSGETKH
jgi:CDP-diacylglycerol---serine O-phosphatidyltransferase